MDKTIFHLEHSEWSNIKYKFVKINTLIVLNQAYKEIYLEKETKIRKIN